MPKKDDHEQQNLRKTIQTQKNMQDQMHDNTIRYNGVHRNESKSKHVDIILFVLCVMVLNCLPEVKAFLTNLNKPYAKKHLRTSTLLAVQILSLRNTLGVITVGRQDNSETLDLSTIEIFYKPFLENNIKCCLTVNKLNIKPIISSKLVVDYVVTILTHFNQYHIYVEMIDYIEQFKLKYPHATNRNIAENMFTNFSDIYTSDIKHPAHSYDILQVPM